MTKKIVIYGLGSFAELMHYYFSTESEYEVVAFTVDSVFLQNHLYCGLPVIPFEDVENYYPPSDFSMFVAIGYKNMRNRKLLFEKAKSKNYKLVNFVSKKAITHDNFILGENNVIMGDVNIEPFVTISDNNVFWSGSLICHHCNIQSHNYFAPSSVLSGYVVVKNLCFFGTGCSVIDKLTIANESFLIAGSVLFETTRPYTRYVGNPAKPFGNSHENTGIVISR